MPLRPSSARHTKSGGLGLKTKTFLLLLSIALGILFLRASLHLPTASCKAAQF